MNTQKLKGILGLSVRAGQAGFGEDVCRRMLDGGRCGMIFLDEEASLNTRRRYEQQCRRAGARLVILPAGFICDATGRPNMAMSLGKGTFAEQAEGCLE